MFPSVPLHSLSAPSGNALCLHPVRSAPFCHNLHQATHRPAAPISPAAVSPETPSSFPSRPHGKPCDKRHPRCTSQRTPVFQGIFCFSEAWSSVPACQELLEPPSHNRDTDHSLRRSPDSNLPYGFGFPHSTPCGPPDDSQHLNDLLYLFPDCTGSIGTGPYCTYPSDYLLHIRKEQQNTSLHSETAGAVSCPEALLCPKKKRV